MLVGIMGQRQFTVAEVAQQLRRSTDTVLLAIKNKRLRATRIGERKWSIAETDLEQWIVEGSRTAQLPPDELSAIWTDQGDENSRSASRLRKPQ